MPRINIYVTTELKEDLEKANDLDLHFNLSKICSDALYKALNPNGTARDRKRSELLEATKQTTTPEGLQPIVLELIREVFK